MGMFINVEINQAKFTTNAEREACARTCPVDALRVEGDQVRIDPENEDECIFCDLCVQKAPAGAIKVVKTYQEWLTRK